MGEIDPKPPRLISEIKRMYEEFDVFICHASEDKERVARPLHEALVATDVAAFLDEECIKWGDSFVEKINHALSRAKIVLVVLSKNSVDKEWPKKELNASLAREIEGQTKVLPLMVGSDDEIDVLRRKIPLLQDIRYEKWKDSPADVAEEIKKSLP